MFEFLWQVLGRILVKKLIKILGNLCFFYYSYIMNKNFFRKILIVTFNFANRLFNDFPRLFNFVFKDKY